MEKEILIEAERLIKEKNELISSKCVCKELKKKFKKDDVKSCKKKIKKLFENEQVTFFFSRRVRDSTNNKKSFRYRA